MIRCSKCGCEWDESGFYACKGKIEMPCIECRLDKKSINYCNNYEDILERQRQAYHDPAKHEANKAYHAQKQREYRARKTTATQPSV